MQIDQQTMNAAVAKAILDSLGENGAQLVIQQAVQALLEPVKQDHYSSKPPKTHLQQMFDEEVRRASGQIVRDILHENVEFKGRVGALVHEALDKLFEGERLATKLAELIEQAIGRMHLSRE